MKTMDAFEYDWEQFGKGYMGGIRVANDYEFRDDRGPAFSIIITDTLKIVVIVPLVHWLWVRLDDLVSFFIPQTHSVTCMHASYCLACLLACLMSGGWVPLDSRSLVHPPNECVSVRVRAS